MPLTWKPCTQSEIEATRLKHKVRRLSRKLLTLRAEECTELHRKQMASLIAELTALGLKDVTLRPRYAANRVMRKKQRGECLNCSAAAVSGRTRCARHLEAYRKYQNKHNAEKRLNTVTEETT